MTRSTWAGIFPSLATPFLPNGDLGLDDQRAITRFALDSGSHGLICFGLAGEVFRLTPEERIELLRVIADQTAGEVPVLAGVGTEAEHTSIRLARAAVDAGADGLVIPPPITAPASTSELIRYFETIAAAVDVPVMIQDAPEYLKLEVGPHVVEQLLSRIPNFVALKLEVGAHALVPWVESFSDDLAIFCGDGGMYMIDCLQHGAVGIAPGVDVVDVLVDIHDLLQNSGEAEAWVKMREILPLLVFQMTTDIDHYNATAKYILRKRGLVTNDELRAPAYRLIPASRSILDGYLAELSLVTV
jgi:4-hydroxy-tetrahydrodipicolinate synthase